MDAYSLKNYGIDYEKGLTTCMGSPDFYKKILSMFLNDQCFSRAKTAFAEGNQKELFERMHELKGTSGSAALTDLYDSIVPLVELVRDCNGNPEEVNKLFSEVEKAYDRSCEGIKIFIAEE